MIERERSEGAKQKKREREKKGEGDEKQNNWQNRIERSNSNSKGWARLLTSTSEIDSNLYVCARNARVAQHVVFTQSSRRFPLCPVKC